MGNYSSDDLASLPATSADLTHVYDATDLSNVGTDDTNYVNQTGSAGYELHQYKDSITAANANVTWKGKSSLAPSSSKVQLQVYKVAAPAGWQDVSGAGASNNVAAADTDFTLSGTIATADYLDTGVTTFRIYQQAAGGGTVYIGEGTHDGGLACDFTGCEDNWLKSADPTVNCGGSTIAQMTGDETQVTLVKFSGLSNISSSVTVTAVSLFFWNHDGGGGTQEITLRRLLRNWTVGTADQVYQSGSSSWNVYGPTDSDTWTSGGALSNGNDKSNTISWQGDKTSTSGSTPVLLEFIGGAQLIADVQDMVTTPANNFGWHFDGYDAGAGGATMRFATSQDATQGYRPYIKVTYTN